DVGDEMTEPENPEIAMAEGAESHRPRRRHDPADSFRGFRSPGHCLDCTRCAAVTGNSVQRICSVVPEWQSCRDGGQNWMHSVAREGAADLKCLRSRGCRF